MLQQAPKLAGLTPYSSFYPFYAPQLMAGLYLGLGDDPARPKSFQLLPAYTHLGQRSQVLEAVRKACFFDQCDVVSGLVSYATMPEVLPLLGQFGKIGLFFDLGELLPGPECLSPSVFYSSHQLWQGEYALGRFAQSEFGDGGYLVMAQYEAGYHLGAAFQAGLGDAGGQAVRLNVFQNPPGGNLPDLAPLFAAISKEAPPYVHALLSGPHGEAFIAAWAAAGMAGKIPLLVSDMMVQEDVLQDLEHLSVSLYAPALWMKDSENLHNRKFVKTFLQKTQQPANVFALLGYEMGLALAPHRALLEKRRWDELAGKLRQETCPGPRGERCLYPDAGFLPPPIDLIKVQLGSGKAKRTVVAQGTPASHLQESLRNIRALSVSGWQNPYLCY